MSHQPPFGHNPQVDPNTGVPYAYIVQQAAGRPPASVPPVSPQPPPAPPPPRPEETPIHLPETAASRALAAGADTRIRARARQQRRDLRRAWWRRYGVGILFWAGIPILSIAVAVYFWLTGALD